jgi:hypothetical protein
MFICIVHILSDCQTVRLSDCTGVVDFNIDF